MPTLKHKTTATNKTSTAKKASTSTRARASTSKSMDALALLKHDHREVEKMFGRFEKAKSSDQKQKLCREICMELKVHAGIEEKSFYPELKKKTSLKEIVLESYEEHKQVKTLVMQLEAMAGHDETMQARMKVLKEDVLHHVQEEEKQLFPKVQKAVGKEQLTTMGEQLRQDKMAMMGSMGRGEQMPIQQRVVEEVRDKAGAMTR